MKTPKISIIAAVGKNRELGKKNALIWRISADLKRVKELTTGHPIIMGQNTYDSIGKPLPHRTNIVISDSKTHIEGCLVFDSLEKGVEKAKSIDTEEIFIFGGARVYRESIGFTDRLYLTIIDAEDKDADVFFPDYLDFKEVLEHTTGVENDIGYAWVTLERVHPFI